jgi:hypothetical protein
MLQVMLKTFLGIFLLIGGFGLGYFYLTNIDNGSSALLLIPALGSVIAGIFLLMRAGKSDATVMQVPKGLDENKSETTQKSNLLEKNNAMTQQWLKSVETRDKMRLLEMAANAEENPAP